MIVTAAVTKGVAIEVPVCGPANLVLHVSLICAAQTSTPGAAKATFFAPHGAVKHVHVTALSKIPKPYVVCECLP
jgi:hypothetical protein